MKLILFFISLLIASLHADDIKPRKVPVDPKVKPHITNQAPIKREHAGCIVVNIYLDNGKVTYTGENNKALKDDEAINKHILNSKTAILKKNKNAKLTLFLRADRKCQWKDVVKIQDAAAKAGIQDVVFASFSMKDTEKKETTPKQK